MFFMFETISYALSCQIITDPQVLQQNSLLRKWKNTGVMAALGWMPA